MAWAEMVTLAYICQCGYEHTRKFVGLTADEVVTIHHICSPKPADRTP